jgi:16S rRNA (cytosine967-C5)-methyltransferase
VRANRRKGDRAALAAWLGDLGIATHPTEIARDGLVIETRRNVYEMEPFRAGWMELQDEGSQLIAELCAPPPRGRVVDACAGAGGKTLALAALLDNQGRVTALDPSERKLEELKRRARRAGLSNVRALAVPGEGPLPEAVRAAAPPGSADRVLVDAPCSGTGVLKRNPETRWRLAEREVAALSALQSRLCARFAELVAPGGRLIYATCSLLDCENREVAARFLAAHPGFEPVPAKEILGKPRALLLGDGDVLELSPDRTETDGFFAAVFRRRS